MALVLVLTASVIAIIGIVSGLRAMTGLAAASWAAWLGAIDLSASPWLAWLGFAWTPWIISALAMAELVTDKLPTTPSRKVPVQFGTRILVGAIAGAALGYSVHQMLPGAGVGAIGAVIGTLGGASVRARLAAKFGADRPAALIEDLVAILGAVAVVGYLA